MVKYVKSISYIPLLQIQLQGTIQLLEKGAASMNIIDVLPIINCLIDCIAQPYTAIQK